MAEPKAGPHNWDWQMIREDRITHGAWRHPGFRSLAVHRFGVWARSLAHPWRGLAVRVHRVLFNRMRNVHGVELPATARIGRRVWLPHPTGVVVGAGAEIGDDCVLRQNVTVGAVNRERLEWPVVGDGVEIGAGAVVIGPVRIGDRARIGPNAVVMTDVPAGACAFVAPAKVMSPLRNVNRDAS